MKRKTLEKTARLLTAALLLLEVLDKALQLVHHFF